MQCSCSVVQFLGTLVKFLVQALVAFSISAAYSIERRVYSVVYTGLRIKELKCHEYTHIWIITGLSKLKLRLFLPSHLSHDSEAFRNFSEQTVVYSDWVGRILHKWASYFKPNNIMTITNLTENLRIEKILQASSGSSRSFWWGGLKLYLLLQNQKSRFTLWILRLWTIDQKKTIKEIMSVLSLELDRTKSEIVRVSYSMVFENLYMAYAKLQAQWEMKKMFFLS